MSFQLSKPSLPLSPYIKHYWAIEDHLPSGNELLQRVVPNGLMELVFYLGDRPRVLNENKLLKENSILSGQQKGYFDMLVTGRLSVFSICFQPTCFSMFFDVPSNELIDQNVALKELVKGEADELESRLFESPSFRHRVECVEEFLLRQLCKNKKMYERDRMIHSISQINNNRGLVSIDTLASAACLSRKQYERSFAEFVGASPKQFLRTVRFQNSLHVKQMNKNLSLGELAYTCGYSDQSHMINEYKIMSGKTPTNYFSECEPYSDYFQ